MRKTFFSHKVLYRRIKNYAFCTEVCYETEREKIEKTGTVIGEEWLNAQARLVLETGV